MSHAAYRPVSLVEQRYPYYRVFPEIQKLENTASRTKCLAKTLNFFFLPCSLPLGCIYISCFALYKSKTSYYYDDQEIVYAEGTSCNCPGYWNPRQEHPEYLPPSTISEIFAREWCDPFGLLVCCSAQINTQDFLNQEQRQKYNDLLQLKQQMLATRGPFPQTMKENPDRRACFIGQAMIKLAGKEMFESRVLDIIINLAGQPGPLPPNNPAPRKPFYHHTYSPPPSGPINGARQRGIAGPY